MFWSLQEMKNKSQKKTWRAQHSVLLSCELIFSTRKRSHSKGFTMTVHNPMNFASFDLKSLERVKHNDTDRMI